MNWTPTIYVQFPDEPTARAAAVALGADFPADGSVPSGDNNYALAAPIVEWLTRPTYAVVDGAVTMTDPGAQRSGYWAMMKFNLGTAEGVAAYAQFRAQMASAIQSLASPGNIFLGDL